MAIKCYTFAFHLAIHFVPWLYQTEGWPRVMIQPGSIHSLDQSMEVCAKNITTMPTLWLHTRGFLWASLHAGPLPILSNLWHDSLLAQAMICVETLLAFFTLDCLFQIQFGEQGWLLVSKTHAHITGVDIQTIQVISLDLVSWRSRRLDMTDQWYSLISCKHVSPKASIYIFKTNE